jgi:hypothetical protein
LLLNLHHQKTGLYDPVKACDGYLHFLFMLFVKAQPAVASAPSNGLKPGIIPVPLHSPVEAKRTVTNF